MLEGLRAVGHLTAEGEEDTGPSWRSGLGFRFTQAKFSRVDGLTADIFLQQTIWCQTGTQKKIPADTAHLAKESCSLERCISES